MNRVLHMISGGDIGGGKTHVLTLVSEIQKEISAQIMCFMEGSFSQEARAMGLDVIVLKQHGRQDLSVVKSIIAHVREQDVDIVHSHGARANFLTMLSKPWIKVPCVTTVHSDYRRDFEGNLYKHLVYTSLNSISLRVFDHYIVISDELKRVLVKRGIAEERIDSVRNYLSRRVEHLRRDEFMRAHGLRFAENTPLVGVLGRLHPVKGQEDFLKAASLVHARFPDAHFLLGGDGEALGSLRSLANRLNISSHVWFLGHIQNPFDFLNVLDVHVLPSRSETFPYVILEAAALGIPTVSTDVGSVSEIIRNGETGLLVSPSDVPALSEAIIYLLSHPDDARKMGQNLKEAASPYFQPSNMAKRHIEIYNKVLQRKPHGRYSM
ncbi:MAG: glycosyltransferase family 4 protein [Bacillota bacterium]